MKKRRHIRFSPIYPPQPTSMATKTNERTNERHDHDPETSHRCLISAHRIAIEADRLKYCFSLYDASPTLSRTINCALEVIDKQMAYLTDIMAAIPTQPDDHHP